MKKQYGLIGYPLSHSFSEKYFADKFRRERISDSDYNMFEMEEIEMVEKVFQMMNLRGFNVTIPHKHKIMNYLDRFDSSATKVGAVNVVKINEDGSRDGYNSDYYGFKTSLENWLPEEESFRALVLGTGGSAKAVYAVLKDLSIPFLKISRDPDKGDHTYKSLLQEPEVLQRHLLIINTTPLGMSPNTDAKPNIDYKKLNSSFYLYDLIYNPAETQFLAFGKKNHANIKNGLEMLELQAEKSWEIWNS